jgi:hypothetical protein
MLRAVPLPIIRSPLTVHLALVYVIRFEDTFRAGPRWNAFHPGPALKLSPNRRTCTSAKYTVNELLMMGSGTARNM